MNTNFLPDEESPQNIPQQYKGVSPFKIAQKQILGQVYHDNQVSKSQQPSYDLEWLYNDQKQIQANYQLSKLFDLQHQRLQSYGNKSQQYEIKASNSLQPGTQGNQKQIEVEKQLEIQLSRQWSSQNLNRRSTHPPEHERGQSQKKEKVKQDCNSSKSPNAYRKVSFDDSVQILTQRDDGFISAPSLEAPEMCMQEKNFIAYLKVVFRSRINIQDKVDFHDTLGKIQIECEKMFGTQMALLKQDIDNFVDDTYSRLQDQVKFEKQCSIGGIKKLFQDIGHQDCLCTFCSEIKPQCLRSLNHQRLLCYLNKLLQESNNAKLFETLSILLNLLVDEDLIRQSIEMGVVKLLLYISDKKGLDLRCKKVAVSVLVLVTTSDYYLQGQDGGLLLVQQLLQIFIGCREPPQIIVYLRLIQHLTYNLTYSNHLIACGALDAIAFHAQNWSQVVQHEAILSLLLLLHSPTASKVDNLQTLQALQKLISTVLKENSHTVSIGQIDRINDSQDIKIAQTEYNSKTLNEVFAASQLETYRNDRRIMADDLDKVSIKNDKVLLILHLALLLLERHVTSLDHCDNIVEQIKQQMCTQLESNIKNLLSQNASCTLKQDLDQNLKYQYSFQKSNQRQKDKPRIPMLQLSGQSKQQKYIINSIECISQYFKKNIEFCKDSLLLSALYQTLVLVEQYNRPFYIQ